MSAHMGMFAVKGQFRGSWAAAGIRRQANREIRLPPGAVLPRGSGEWPEWGMTGRLGPQQRMAVHGNSGPSPAARPTTPWRRFQPFA
jgi:hypothetical protein